MVWQKFVLLLVVGVSVPQAHAQASATAERRLDVQIGGMFSIANPGVASGESVRYGRWDCKGAAIYLTIDPMRHYGFETSVREVYDGTSGLHERTYQAGPRIFRRFGSVVPYGKLMYGRGVLNYPRRLGNLAFNEGVVGGGVDWALSSALHVRGDYEYQRWFGFSNIVKGFPGQLDPQVVSIGIAYHVQ